MLYFRFSNRFAKRYDELDATDQARIDRALELLDTNWKHPSLHVKKVQGHEGVWEARVSQAIRLTFQIEGKYQELDVCVLRPVEGTQSPKQVPQSERLEKTSAVHYIVLI